MTKCTHILWGTLEIDLTGHTQFGQQRHCGKRHHQPACPHCVSVSVWKMYSVSGFLTTRLNTGLILGFAPSQWEMALLYNDVSHWLGSNLESALEYLTGCWEEARAHPLKYCHILLWYHSYFNPCLMEFILVDVCVCVLLFLNHDMAQIVEILPRGRLGSSYPA